MEFIPYGVDVKDAQRKNDSDSFSEVMQVACQNSYKNHNQYYCCWKDLNLYYI